MLISFRAEITHIKSSFRAKGKGLGFQVSSGRVVVCWLALGHRMSSSITGYELGSTRYGKWFGVPVPRTYPMNSPLKDRTC